MKRNGVLLKKGVGSKFLKREMSASRSLVNQAPSITHIRGITAARENKPMNNNAPHINSILPVKPAENEGKGILRDWK